MSIHQSRPFLLWVKEVLTDGGVTVEIMKKPATVPTLQGYAVIYPVAGGTTEGSIDAPRSDASPNVQVTSFGRDEDQAMWLSDKVRTLLDAAVPATLPDGRKAIWMDFATASPTGTRDDKANPPMFMGIDVVEIGTVS